MAMRIVHISSVHPWKDPRIFLKQCRSLADQGFDVHLLTPDSLDEKQNGVQLHRVWNSDPAKLKKSILTKLFRPVKLFKMARSLKPDIIHFHDEDNVSIRKIEYEKNEGALIIYSRHLYMIESEFLEENDLV